jgi:hypothetical protein
VTGGMRRNWRPVKTAETRVHSLTALLLTAKD